MNTKNKKIVIASIVGILLLTLIVLRLLPNKNVINNKEVSESPLEECTNKEINQLMESYFQAKRNVDMDMMEPLVSDINQVNQEKLIFQAEYVEDYQNIKSYAIENPENGSYRVYVRYDMKHKNIETLAPCLSGFYVTQGSDGQYLIYLSALDEAEENFILAADQNPNVVKFMNEVSDALNQAMESDQNLKQMYDRMDQEIKTADMVVNPATSGSSVSEK